MTTLASPVHEGTFAFRGFDIWYRIVGERERDGRVPLVLLHGGPGSTHQYLESLADLASSGRRVIFYDQIGCGRSGGSRDPDFYSAGLFCDELDALREALDLPRIHLLGQSWGGMLAMQYAIGKPAGLASIVVADSPADMTQWISEANRLRADLPARMQAALTLHEKDGTYTHPDYLAATMEFYKRHVCRIDPMPDEVQRTFAAMEQDGFVYNVMNGPSEFHTIGKLKTWTILDRLHTIEIPTLLLSGRHDEATPLIVGSIAERIPHAEWIVFENSSHMPHVEEHAAFVAATRGFLNGVESGMKIGART